VQYVEIGGTRDGKVLALRSSALQDAGAYPQLGAFLVVITRTMATGVYAIPRLEMNVKSVLTNTTPIAAYRGAGRPEATYAIERAMDLFAGEIGMDPVAVRRLNVLPSDAFPFETLGGQTYDSGDYARALDLAVEAADYEALRREQEKRRAQSDVKQLGIGVCTYVEVTNAVPGSEYGSVEVLADGKVRIRAGTLSHGQGHWTTFSMIVSDQLGIGLENIEFIQGDTDEVPFGLGTMGSRSAQTAGAAVLAASVQVETAGRETAATLLEAAVEDIVFDRDAGRFHIAGVPSVSKTWAEVASSRDGAGIRCDVDFSPQGLTFPFGAHVAVVEVDMETGKVNLARHVAVDDAGRILNPLIFEGQVHGGLAQGIAQSLLEEMCYDNDGNPLTSTLAEYAMISAAELPSFQLVRMETPTPLNDLGAKGVGESGTIGATPAVANAVCDALSIRGIRHLDMPFTPQKVWMALKESQR
jgi:aerobic carbon-monoxide dehydrogenase large subunit